MGDLNLYNQNGEVVGKVSIDTQIADYEPKSQVVHDVVVAYRANQRSGTASTKTRGEIKASTAKPWRQKGTGRARSGMRSSPIWRGGGTVFGPRPRDFGKNVSRKQKQAALRSVLAARLQDEKVIVVEKFDFDGPKTKKMVAILDKLGLKDQKNLIVTAGLNRDVVKSANNLPGLDVVTASDVNTYDILSKNNLIIERDVIDIFNQRLLG